MDSKSLRLRLLLAAIVAIGVALSLSGVMLSRLFAQHIETRELAELENHQNQIIASLTLQPGSTIEVSPPPADPRFSTPHGGLYWQIDLPTGQRERSRSLWEAELILPPDHVPDGTRHRHTIAGPANQRVLALERGLTVGPDNAPVSIRIAVAVDLNEMNAAIAGFQRVVWVSLSILGLALVLASLGQVYVGLRPFERLRIALKRVHSGEAGHVSGDFVSEVQPLVDDVNALLDRESLNRQRARERAADLAHGFKTPLAVLSAVARELSRDGRSEAAREINAQIDLMGRHVTSEIARARTVGATSIRRNAVPVKPIADKIVVALGRISADRGLHWSVTIPPATAFAGDENDLLELLGNLADNAAKWARSRVNISASQTDQGLVIRVSDDGHGIPPGSEHEVILRGRRLDESTDGSGLGLSIVAKIVEAYKGKIVLGKSATGGLEVTITL